VSPCVMQGLASCSPVWYSGAVVVVDSEKKPFTHAFYPWSNQGPRLGRSCKRFFYCPFGIRHKSLSGKISYRGLRKRVAVIRRGIGSP
jgi:hypothetical protein